jgi:hypothetical protein
MHWAVGFMFVVSAIGGWYAYRRLTSRYAGNLALLQSLAEREGDSVYDLEVLPEEHPLLERWNQRLEKRALLWRVDRFLSTPNYEEPSASSTKCSGDKYRNNTKGSP